MALALQELGRFHDADAIYLTAQASEAMGKTDQAVRLYRQIYYELPATNARVQAEARLAALNASPKDNAGSFAEERSRADALFEARQYGEATAAYEQLLAHPKDFALFRPIHVGPALRSAELEMAAEELNEPHAFQFTREVVTVPAE